MSTRKKRRARKLARRAQRLKLRAARAGRRSADGNDARSELRVRVESDAEADEHTVIVELPTPTSAEPLRTKLRSVAGFVAYDGARKLTVRVDGGEALDEVLEVVSSRVGEL